MITRIDAVTLPDPTDRALERLRETGRAYVDFALREPGLFAVAFTAAHPRPESPHSRPPRARRADRPLRRAQRRPGRAGRGAARSPPSDGRAPTSPAGRWSTGSPSLNVHGPLREVPDEVREPCARGRARRHPARPDVADASPTRQPSVSRSKTYVEQLATPSRGRRGRPGRDRAPQGVDHPAVGDHEHGLPAVLVGQAVQDPEHPVGGLPAGLTAGYADLEVTGQPAGHQRLEERRVERPAQVVTGGELLQPLAHPHRQPEHTRRDLGGLHGPRELAARHRGDPLRPQPLPQVARLLAARARSGCPPWRSSPGSRTPPPRAARR